MLAVAATRCDPSRRGRQSSDRVDIVPAVFRDPEARVRKVNLVTAGGYSCKRRCLKVASFPALPLASAWDRASHISTPRLPGVASEPSFAACVHPSMRPGWRNVTSI
jgi:hypothetical protein